jgi:hypothetical protein
MIALMVLEENYDYHSVFGGDNDMVLSLIVSS